MIVTCTKVVQYEIRIYEQDHYDPDDGTRAGTYAQVGPPDDQAEFMVGPYKSRMEARTKAVQRLERMGYQVKRL